MSLVSPFQYTHLSQVTTVIVYPLSTQIIIIIRLEASLRRAMRLGLYTADDSTPTQPAADSLDDQGRINR